MTYINPKQWLPNIIKIVIGGLIVGAGILLLAHHNQTKKAEETAKQEHAYYLKVYKHNHEVIEILGVIFDSLWTQLTTDRYLSTSTYSIDSDYYTAVNVGNNIILYSETLHLKRDVILAMGIMREFNAIHYYDSVQYHCDRQAWVNRINPAAVACRHSYTVALLYIINKREELRK